MMGKHFVDRKHKRPTPTTIRRRLFLESLLPPGVPPTEAAMLQYYGWQP